MNIRVQYHILNDEYTSPVLLIHISSDLCQSESTIRTLLQDQPQINEETALTFPQETICVSTSLFELSFGLTDPELRIVLWTDEFRAKARTRAAGHSRLQQFIRTHLSLTRGAIELPTCCGTSRADVRTKEVRVSQCRTLRARQYRTVCHSMASVK